MKNILLLATSLFIITSCGGGGGGGSSPAPTPSAPANPPISITFSSSLTSPVIGDETTLTWSTSNATSCSATGSWSGDKGTSGSETLKLTISGNITFGLSCTSSSLSGSKSLTIAVTPALNAYAYINGPTEFVGFFIKTRESGLIEVRAVEVGMDINDNNSLFIPYFYYNENRFLSQYHDDTSGFKFGDKNFNINEDGEQVTYSMPIVSPTFHSTNQVLLNTDSSLNPFTYEPDTLDDFEQFNADITLSFENYTDGSSRPSIQMSTIAFPKDSENSNDAAFVGSSNNGDGTWSFLYIVDKREVEKYNDNLVSESDIFNISWGMSALYTSFLSNPNFEVFEDGIRVKSTQKTYLRTTPREAGTLAGARAADLIDATSPSNAVKFGGTDAYAVKWLQPEPSSKFRAHVKYSLSRDCNLSSYNGNCIISNPQLYFFTPGKEGLIGLTLGGEFGLPEETTVRFLSNID